MDYHSDLWLGYLSGLLVRRCVELSILRCPGCNDKLKSPLLHLHQQQSLLDKICIHFNEVKDVLFSTIDELYDVAKHKLPQSDNRSKDKEIYTNNGLCFLETSNAESLYYGRYLCGENDFIINELLLQKPSKKRKIPVQCESPETNGIQVTKRRAKKQKQTHHPQQDEPQQSSSTDLADIFLNALTAHPNILINS